MSDANTNLSPEQLLAEIERLRSENEGLKAHKNPALSFKIGEKGGVSVYGLSARFPVTLYKQQWERLIEAVPRLQAFLVEHASELKTK